MCVGPGMKMGQGTYTPRDFAKEGYINNGQGVFGGTSWKKPETQSSPASQSSGNSQMPYSDGQQQQVQPASMPRATTGRFSFNNGNFRIGDSNMNSSDAGLNI